MKRLMSFMAGAITGALVGATLMVLFAPAPGETIRSDLQNRIQQMRDDMQEAAAARRREMEAQLANLRAPRAGGEES